jgi:hypothetical protein
MNNHPTQQEELTLKKLLLTILLLSLLAFSLSGCAKSTDAATSAGSTAQDAQDAQGNPQAGGNIELSEPTQLAIGTLKLEGTDLAVRVDQAAELLPLWQAYQSLSTSSTAASIEIQGVLDQIKETMSSEQMQAIAAMDISGQNMGELMQSLGVDTFLPQGTPDPNSEDGFKLPEGFVPGAGGGPEVNRRGEGAGPFAGGEGGSFSPPEGLTQGEAPDPALLETAQASGRFQGGGDRFSPMILQALIQKLQSKTTADGDS